MKVIYRDVFREIKNSAGRFVSLLLIVILGVAFYAGVRSSCPDLKLSADQIYDQYNLSDIQVMSTLGITEGDISALSKVDGVEKAIGSYSYDFLARTGDFQSVIKVKGLTEGVNEVNITSGRMPEEKDECLINACLQKLDDYRLGDEIELTSGDDKNISDIISTQKFTVVGTFTTPEHLTYSLGSTSIGDGSLDGIMMVLPEVFELETFTEANILVEGVKELNCYSAEYEAKISEVVDNIEDISEERTRIRQEEIQDRANEELSKARKEFEEGKAKLEDARNQWQDGRQQLDDAIVQYNNGVTEIQKGRKELESQRPELEKNKKLLEEKWVEYYEGEAEYQAGYQEFIVKKAEAEEQIRTATDQLNQVEEAIKDIVGPNRLERIRAVIRAITGQDTFLEQYRAYAMQQIEEGKAQLAEAEAQLAEAEAKLAEGRAQLEAAQAQFDDGEAKFKQGEADLASGEQKLIDAKKQIDAGEAELASGLQEIEKGEEQLKDAEKQLDDAEKEIAKIEKAEWYILDRSYLADYSAFNNNADSIGNIGKVFPVIFFVVAALVCLTSMTRMVDEERTQIGTLKALGYGKFMIMRKYIIYAVFAVVVGAVIGILVGGKAIPALILSKIKMIYPDMTIILIPYNAEHSLAGGLAAFVSVLAATLFACVKALREVPASLMRPVPPKQSKKILLERIPALWSKINFHWKNALRNFVRYKKRLLMTLFGICGSTALILVGFGLEDSIGEILYTQYGEICTYDELMSLDPNITDRNRAELEKALNNDERIACYSFVYENSVETESDYSDKVMKGYFYVPENPENISRTVSLRDRKSKKELTLNDEGVILTEKMADGLNAAAGDVITVSFKENKSTVSKTVTVSAVTENYINDYVYMTPALYEETFGKKAESNVVEVKFDDEVIATAAEDPSAVKDGATKTSDAAVFDEKDFCEEYLSYGAVGGITSVTDLLERYGGTFESLDSVILILVLCAGALAFVVLYNLNNINISERRRELATLKVLGFYDIELSRYIYRENILITILGIALGLAGGVFLTRYVIATVEVDMLMFGRAIYAPSFIWSSLIALGFTVIVNVIVHFKLKTIDMATSLKSVE